MQQKSLLLTCEHATNTIPRSLGLFFQQAKEIVASHRGYDLGALGYARALASHFGCPLFSGTVSRLIIDVNRSIHHPKLFSEYTRFLSEQKKRDLLHRYWLPFREKVLTAVEEALLENKKIYHFSCHSFTPILQSVVRSCDIGILYNPKREREKEAASLLQKRLVSETKLRVRMNYPYRGTADGHTTALRHTFEGGDYIGIEVEVNQALLETDYWRYVGLEALKRAIHDVWKL